MWIVLPIALDRQGDKGKNVINFQFIERGLSGD